MGQFRLIYIQEFGCQYLRVALRHLGLPFNQFWLLLADMVGERAIINQLGVILEILGDGFQLIAEHRLRCSQALDKRFRFADLQVTGRKLILYLREPLTQLGCISAKALNLFVFIRADFLPGADFGGKRSGEIPHLRQKFAHVVKFVAL